MKNNFKNVFVVIGLVASIMVVLGGLIGWFSFPPNLQELTSSDQALRETINAVKGVSMFVGIVCLALVVLAARFRKLFLPIIILPLSGFIALAVLNNLRSIGKLKDYDIAVAPGYWISMVGSLALLAAAVGIIINILKKPQPANAVLPQMPSNQTPVMSPVTGSVSSVLNTPTPQMPPTPVSPPVSPGVTSPMPQPPAVPIPPQPSQQIPTPSYRQPTPTPPPNETPPTITPPPPVA